MSLKNDIEMVKEELNSEEKFFEKAVVTERFVKKYKNLMIGAVVAVVIGVGVNMTMEASKASDIASANEQLLFLQKDNTNKSALAELQKRSPALFELYNYSQAIVNNDVKALSSLQSSKAPLLSDLASYEVASRAKNSNDLENYTSKQGGIYKELAQLQLAVMLIDEGKVKQAQEKLSTIEEGSPLFKVARALRHYGVN